MKFAVPFLCAIAACATNDVIVEDPIEGYSDGDRFFYFPDGEGKLHLVDSQKPVNKAYIISYSNRDNTYMLYTRHNPLSPQFLITGDVNSVRNSFFNPAKETVFYAHGWRSNGFTVSCKMITEAFLQNKDVNVIILDWSRMANRFYVTTVQGVPKVGTELGEFINWLTSLGLSYDNIHLVGHSLGGHLVGNGGRATQGKVRRITALDPAGPLWTCNSNRIVNTDGQYVEVIHTNAFLLGFKHPCGDADFYPSGGRRMPGCWFSTCSHSRALDYMVSSVKNNHFYANECESMWHVQYNQCSGPLYPMGNSDLSKNRSGIFRINVRAQYPF